MTAQIPSCGDCVYCHKEKGNLSCRFFPPQVTIFMVPMRTLLDKEPKVGYQTQATFPPVTKEIWCGHFESRSTTQTN